MASLTCVHCASPLPEGSHFCPTCGAHTQDPGSSPRVSFGTTADLLIRLRAALQGRYEIRELLGRGGMGAVFLATDLSLERPVAIKVLPPDLSEDKKFFKRFAHEARTAAKLDHPNIIPIYAVEGADDLHYFVMKYVTGRTLDQLLQAGPLPVDVAQRILWEAACALGHAHQRGVVHRDVKPANILIDDHGRALVTDFGISKALESAHQFTTTGQVIGTPHYMSPEQAKGIPVDGRTDQYSLAIVGYRMLAGRLPFTDDSVHTVIYKHIFEMPPPLEMFRRDAPEFLRQAIHRALEKDVEDRFLTMEAFATAVWPEHPVRDYSVSAGMSRTSLDAATEITLPRRGKRRGARLAMALGAVLVLAGGGAAGASLLLNRATSGGTGAPSGASTQPTFIAAADTQPVASSPRVDSAAAPPGTAADTAASGPPPAPPRVTVDPPVQRPAPAQPAREQPAVPEVGYVTIGVTYNGEPSYATVMIDGREIGEAPIIELQLPAGRHTLEIRREGYRPILDSIVVQPGDPSRATRVTKPLVKEQP